MSQFEIEKRFGCTAVKKGYITEDQLTEAIVIQIKEDLAIGKHRQIGDILVSLGYMTEGSVIKVLRAMKHAINFYDGYIGVFASTASIIKKADKDIPLC